MYPLKFEPYIGSRYKAAPLKVLVLGESHYLAEADKNNKNVTKEVLQRYLAYKNGQQAEESWMNTFTKFSNVFANKKLSNQETLSLWETLAFYNYVQVPMKGPGDRPSSLDFSESHEAFRTVLSQLSPDLIIFWGDDLWNHFRKDSYAKEGALHVLTYGKKYPIFVSAHPASPKFNANMQKIAEELQGYKMEL